jgi:hypothetical protein
LTISAIIGWAEVNHDYFRAVGAVFTNPIVCGNFDFFGTSCDDNIFIAFAEKVFWV